MSFNWIDEAFDEESKKLNKALKDLADAKKAIRIMLPIVEAAFWDQHTAGTLPGSGYHNKAEHLAGVQWDWRTSSRFKEWKAALKEIVDKNE